MGSINDRTQIRFMGSAKPNPPTSTLPWGTRTEIARSLGFQLLAATAGIALFTPPFFYLGSMSKQPTLGVAVGLGIGTLVGLCLLNSIIGSSVLWIVGFAVVGAMLGPGGDADPVSSALFGTAIGSFFAITKWRGFIGIGGGILVANIGGDIVGFGIGVALGLSITYWWSPAKSHSRAPTRGAQIHPSNTGAYNGRASLR